MQLFTRKPSPAFVVATAALALSLGGTSAYAYSAITSADIKDNSVRSVDVKNGTLRIKDLNDNAVDALRGQRGARGPQGPRGAQGQQGQQGEQGEQGPAGAGRWLLVNAAGEIEAQSGGFTIASAYDTINNTENPDGTPGTVPLGAIGNVYIDAHEDLSDNAIVATIALQNQTDQNNDAVKNGRSLNPDANPEFSGEITTTRCGIAGIVACAPTGTDNAEYFVVSPRLSDGQVTSAETRKRFYVVISGDSTDYVAP